MTQKSGFVSNKFIILVSFSLANRIESEMFQLGKITFNIMMSCNFLRDDTVNVFLFTYIDSCRMSTLISRWCLFKVQISMFNILWASHEFLMRSCGFVWKFSILNRVQNILTIKIIEFINCCQRDSCEFRPVKIRWIFHWNCGMVELGLAYSYL